MRIPDGASGRTLTIASADRPTAHPNGVRRPGAFLIWGYADLVSGDVDQIPELDLRALIADMTAPTSDDVPMAPDWTPLDTPAKVIARLEQINAERLAAAGRAG